LGYVKVENNPYVFSYLLSAWDTTLCHTAPYYLPFCDEGYNTWTIDHDWIFAIIKINIKYNAPLPTVKFYMKVEKTGQVILIDTLTKQTGYYTTTRGYYYVEGEQVNPDSTTSQNPLTTIVVAFTTFKIKAIMNDINGNPAYVYAPISIYATITMPDGTITTEPIVIDHLNFPTRIVNLRISSNTVEPGQKITVSGQLQRLAPNGQWVGLPGQKVYIQRVVYHIVEFIYSTEGTSITDVNGNFSATITAPPEQGTHTLYVRYLGNSNESLSGTYATISLTVIGSVKQTPTQTTVKPKLSAGDLAIVGGGLVVLVGIVAYGVSKRKK